jgi:2-polyprenyl-6-methoxyphenol hydroxylase-like FAD-dependent oxidoreductase
MQPPAPDKNTDVLIVGAGPSGLMMACQLAIRNINFRIIDRKDRYTNYSGALIIHARSLEIFQQMGIAQVAINKGSIANDINIVFNEKKSFRIPIRNIGKGLTQFPYFLMLEQSKTEQILTDFIRSYGYSIGRNTEFISLTQNADSITSILKLSDGKCEIVNSKFLVAADGGQSTIRQQLQIPFVGKTHTMSLFVTDCKMEGNVPADQISFSFSKSATTGLFPLPNGRWRIDGTIPAELDTNKILSFDEIAESFASRTALKVKIYEPQWFSVFHSHHRYALSFQHHRCFLIGDAAHIHSPVGAQGMNTGMQDAYNLAWKLAFVLQKKTSVSLLETYTQERKVIAINVINYTDKAFDLVTSQNFLIKILRCKVAPIILQLTIRLLQKQKSLRQFFFIRISQIGVNYRKTSITGNTSLRSFPNHAPKPGERLPYLVYKEENLEINLQEKLKGPGFHLFIFTKKTPLVQLVSIAEKYKESIRIVTIPYNSGSKYLYKKLGIKSNGFYLIRPDMYIAFRSNKRETGHFNRYLQEFLNE